MRDWRKILGLARELEATWPDYASDLDGRIVAHSTPSIDQGDWRWRDDDGDESDTAIPLSTGATWLKAAATSHDFDVTSGNVNARVRFAIDETNGGTQNNFTGTLQYNINTGGWNNVPTTATTEPVEAHSGSQLVDGNDTTNHGVTVAGSFVTANAGQCEDAVASGTVDFAGNDSTIFEYSITFISANLSDNDSIDFRISECDTYTGGDANATITKTVTVNVTETSGSPDALTITGQAPTVSTDVLVTTGAPDSLTITGQVPTFDNSADVAETTGVPDALTITGQVPTVTTDVLETSGAPNALTITGQVPTVSADALVTTGAPDAIVVNVEDVYSDAVAALFAGNVEAHFRCDEASGAVLTDATGGANGTIVNTAFVQYQESGINSDASDASIGWTTSADYANLGSTRWNFIHNTADFTIAVWLRVGSTDSSVGIVASSGSGLHKGVRLDISPTGFFQGILTNGATSKILTSTTSASVGSEYLIVLTGDGSSFEIYVNGGAAEDSDTVITATGDATNSLILGAQAGLTGQFDGDTQDVTFLDRGITQSEAQAYYDLVKSRRHAVTTDALVTTGAPDALSITGQTPTVSADALVTTGAPDALTITGHIPTVTTSSAVDVTETTGVPDALSITGQAPTVSTDVLVTTGAPDAITISGQAPTATADVNVTTGAPDALTISGQIPTVTTDSSTDVTETTSGVDALTITGQAPTVSTDVLATTGAPDSLTVSGQAPTVSADMLETSGSPDALSITGQAPTVSTSDGVLETTSGPDALSVVGYAPTLLTDANVTTGAPDGLTVVGYAPTINVTATVSVEETTSGVDALTVTGQAPTVSAGAFATIAAAAALVVSGYAPTVATDVNITTAGPDVIVITGQAPTVDVETLAPAGADRTVYVHQETRTVSVRDESRTTFERRKTTLAVSTESRLVLIHAENRTFTA